MFDETICEIISVLNGLGYKPPHPKPLDEEASLNAFWTESNKHKAVTARDVKFLRLYVMAALASGEPFSARGIRILGKGYVRPDKAVMNSCLNEGLVQLHKGVFTITRLGFQKLGVI